MKKLIILVLVIALVIVGFFAFRYLENRGKGSPNIDTNNISQLDNSVFNNDKDLDGITDEKEAEFGTSDFEFDTDKDGISDQDEINIWGTDPLDKDSDGDGFADGLEIINGYNPAGSG